MVQERGGKKERGGKAKKEEENQRQSGLPEAQTWPRTQVLLALAARSTNGCECPHHNFFLRFIYFFKDLFIFLKIYFLFLLDSQIYRGGGEQIERKIFHLMIHSP